MRGMGGGVQTHTFLQDQFCNSSKTKEKLVVGGTKEKLVGGGGTKEKLVGGGAKEKLGGG